MSVTRNHELVRPDNELHFQLYDQLSKKIANPQWFAGVSTTKIACLIGCKAGPPLKQNVMFSRNLLDLLSFGFRECKVCYPLSHKADHHDIQFVLKQIEQSASPDKKFENSDKQVVDWVSHAHLFDLKRYIRVKRVNHLLTTNHPGYPNKIYYRRYWTPIGMMVACFSDAGLCLLEFYDRLMLEAELIHLQKKQKANFKITSAHPISIQLETELNEYFAGKRQEFNIPLEKIGSVFQQAVWSMLERIPFGETWSYQRQAIALNKPSAVRAVANANGKNCISIIVPCHRVIGQDGKLTGYGGGLARKEFLLQLEKSHRLDLKVEPVSPVLLPLQKRNTVVEKRKLIPVLKKNLAQQTKEEKDEEKKLIDSKKQKTNFASPVSTISSAKPSSHSTTLIVDPPERVEHGKI